MRRILTSILIVSALCLGAAAPSAFAEDAPTYVTIPKPAAGTGVLVVMPDVSLSILTAAGGRDPKEEWSQSARKFLNDSLTTALQARKYTTSSIDLVNYEDPRAVQMLKLNSAVTDSITMNQSTIYKMPTKIGFNWTLGDGVSTLVPATANPAPAYALFVRANGSYSSGGRAAMMIGMAALGVSMPMGGQSIQASLIDLKSGQVVWYKLMVVPAGTDIRVAEGAGTAVNDLIKQLPL